jgi:hypothetical protein
MPGILEQSNDITPVASVAPRAPVRSISLIAPWTVLAFAAVVLLIFLGDRGLNEPDEGRYSEIGREMAQTGDWLVPHLNGFEHFQKPPLLYWATATSLRVFGVHEYAARLPSALAALGTIGLTLLLARMLWRDRTTASFAALVLVSMVGFFALARLLTPDMTLTFWITAAIATFLRSRRGGKIWGWLFFVAMGFGFLTKGPMALVVPLCAVALWHGGSGRKHAEARPLPWIGGLCVTLLLGLSWFMAIVLIYPSTADYFWHNELLQRFGSHAHGRTKPFWFFLPVLAAGLMPWTFFVPRLVRHTLARMRTLPFSSTQMLLLGWVIPPFCILSLSGSKLATYVLPLFPAFALGLGRVLALEGYRPSRIWRFAAAASLLWIVSVKVLPFCNDNLRQQASVRALAARIEDRGDPRARIFACEVRAHGLEFYLRRLVSASEAQSDIVLPPDLAQRTRLLPQSDQCEAAILNDALVNHVSAIGVIRASQFGRKFTPSRWEVVDQAGDFLLIQSRSSKLAAGNEPG